MIMTKK